MGDPRNCIDGTADLIDVLLKYGLTTNEDVRSIVNDFATNIVETMKNTAECNGSIAHLLDVLMARAVYRPSEIKELFDL